MKTNGKGSFNSESTDEFLVRPIFKKMNQIVFLHLKFWNLLTKKTKICLEIEDGFKFDNETCKLQGEEHCYWKPNNLWKIVSFICLRSWQMPQYFLKKATFIKNKKILHQINSSTRNDCSTTVIIHKIRFQWR